MPISNYKFKSEVIVYPGMNAWRFLVLPKDKAHKIKKDFSHKAKGWGSLPVNVKIGKSTWKTSIFPDKKSDTYVLPLKAEIRRKEGIDDHSKVSFSIEII